MSMPVKGSCGAGGAVGGKRRGSSGSASRTASTGLAALSVVVQCKPVSNRYAGGGRSSFRHHA